MQKIITPFLVSAGLLLTGVAAQAQLALPGKTLQKPAKSQAGLQQPAKNGKNILSGPVSPCIYETWTLDQVFAYARVNHSDIYRQGIGFRRAQTPKENVRQFMITQICAREGREAPVF